jgi:hypothetical protein
MGKMAIVPEGQLIAARHDVPVFENCGKKPFAHRSASHLS